YSSTVFALLFIAEVFAADSRRFQVGNEVGQVLGFQNLLEAFWHKGEARGRQLLQIVAQNDFFEAIGGAQRNARRSFSRDNPAQLLTRFGLRGVTQVACFNCLVRI